MTPACAALHERGYVVLADEYDADELREIRAILQRAWAAAGRQAGGPEFGFVMHPLFAHAPEMAPFYARPRVIALLAELFGEAPRLAHNGGLWSGTARRFTPWHYHRDDILDDAVVWDPARSERQARITRVLANVYVDGSKPELGELLVSPRAVGDTFAPASLERDREWRCQEVVRCPPGSVVVFDQSVFHAARAAQVDTPRRIFGGHYTGWSESRPHREDNAADLPAVADALAADPVLRALVRGPETPEPPSPADVRAPHGVA